MTTGSVLGIRETRRIVGDYVLTLDDYIARRSFPDEICRNAYFIDVHHSLKQAAAHIQERADGIAVPTLTYGAGESHGIPYRCLTPVGLRNVLVAGRSISCDRPVQGSVRVMPVCLTTGEAAGMAAGMVTRRGNNDVRALDVGDLRRRLCEEGAYLPEPAVAPALETI
ncbi:MAG: FAD-dependent oxidoreductase [Verrucomicrobiota bacterium]